MLHTSGLTRQSLVPLSAGLLGSTKSYFAVWLVSDVVAVAEAFMERSKRHAAH